jgi:type I restriction enzyme M protein
VEIDALGHFWTNYLGLRDRVFDARPAENGDLSAYADFSPAVTDRRALAAMVKDDSSVAAAHSHFFQTLDAWWIAHVPQIEALAPADGTQGNVYALRRALLADLAQDFAGQTLLNEHQVRGAFARYMNDLKADLKSVAASGWGPELIPDSELLESQFPELLADMEQKRMCLAELNALFAAADEEEYEDTDDSGVLPSDQVKRLKAELKEGKAQAKLAKRQRDQVAFELHTHAVASIEARLAKHQALEDEGRRLKAELRANEKKQEQLVEAARAKIATNEARLVILDRMHRLLVETYSEYLRADQRACIAALQNLHDKYAMTAKEIEAARSSSSSALKGYVTELGYA